MGNRLFRLRSVLILLVLLLAAFLTKSFWLPAFANPLIHNDGPAKAEIVVVLAGDQWGGRILKGAQMVRDGYAPLALISSPPGYYEVRDAELAIPFAVRHGYPVEWFAACPNDSHNTVQEAASILDELQRRHISHFLLVTSDYHSARANRIYRNAIRQRQASMTFRMVTSADQYFRPTRWWSTRDSLKVFFLEWNKTISSALGV